MYIKIHSYLAHVGVSKGDKLILQLFTIALPVYSVFCLSSHLATRTSSQVNFPIDFFEHNQQLTDVEFGGNDLLQVYNAQQIKHRLNSTGMYVANTKVNGAIWGFCYCDIIVWIDNLFLEVCVVQMTLYKS